MRLSRILFLLMLHAGLVNGSNQLPITILSSGACFNCFATCNYQRQCDNYNLNWHRRCINMSRMNMWIRRTCDLYY